jgi:AraC-like DNA-binding protein
MRPPQVSNKWSYARRDDGSRIEQAVWCGDVSPALAPHFHDEIQVTIVFKGVRRFLTPAGTATACAGETAVIDPTVPHQPLGLDAPGTVSLNLYVQPTIEMPIAREMRVVATPRWLQHGEWMDRDRLAAWTTDRIALTKTTTRTWNWGAEAVALAAVTAQTELEIGALAADAGMTREGFTRRFHRVVGLTPHAYRIARRLNVARALLASDVAPAEAAADAGFADQSHLGRGFRLSFGTTPNAYRRAMR